MQVEKHLFGVAEKSLRNRNFKIYCTMLYTFSLALAIFFFSVFCFAHSPLMTGKHYLKQCLKEAPQYIKQIDAPILAFYFQPFPQEPQQKQSQTTYIGQHCQIYPNKYINLTLAYPAIQFSSSRSLITLSLQQRQQFKINNLTFIMKYPFIDIKLLGSTPILINELVDIYAKGQKNNKILQFRINYDFFSYNVEDLQFTLLQRLYKLGKAVLFYIFISISTSLYIYGTIISAPALIIMVISVTRLAGNDGMTNVYRIFPWLGLHVIARQTSTNNVVNKTSHAVCAALIFYFLTVYFIYYSVILKSTLVLFDNIHEIGIQQIFCIFIAFIEFACIVFMRTRPFLNFYPKIHNILILIFLIYSTYVQEGYKTYLLICVACLSISLFSWMVVNLEIPAQNQWDKNQSFTPTVDRPRCGMFPIFNMSWINNSPDEWTRMIPLLGRQHFNTQQLAFVDKRYDQLEEGLNRPA